MGIRFSFRGHVPVNMNSECKEKYDKLHSVAEGCGKIEYYMETKEIYINIDSHTSYNTYEDIYDFIKKLNPFVTSVCEIEVVVEGEEESFWLGKEAEIKQRKSEKALIGIELLLKDINREDKDKLRKLLK